jgi:acetolactate decarboxylase
VAECRACCAASGFGIRSSILLTGRIERGSLVGFRFPQYAQGINVAGYHFHFITEDRSAGGHVLDCRLARGELYVDHDADLRLELPPGVGLPKPDPSARREDLDRVERG